MEPRELLWEVHEGWKRWNLGSREEESGDDVSAEEGSERRGPRKDVDWELEEKTYAEKTDLLAKGLKITDGHLKISMQTGEPLNIARLDKGSQSEATSEATAPERTLVSLDCLHEMIDQNRSEDKTLQDRATMPSVPRRFSRREQ